MIRAGIALPVYEALERTQNFRCPLGNGVFRRSTDEDTLLADLEDGMRSYVPAPELSERHGS